MREPSAYTYVSTMRDNPQAFNVLWSLLLTQIS